MTDYKTEGTVVKNLILFLPTKLLRIIFLLLAIFFIDANLWAQISFVQITDPHIFGAKKERIENREALISCINKINERLKEGNDFKFVVITGDLGVANLVSTYDDKMKDTELFNSEEKIGKNLRQGAREFATILTLSKVNEWLFLPGDYDLFDELHDNTRHFNEFIQALQRECSEIQIINLCPNEEDMCAGVYLKSPYVFLGLNNASFKNNDDPKRLQSSYSQQLRAVGLIKAKLDSSECGYVYIFHHIPEIDDYYVVLDDDSELIKSRSKGKRPDNDPNIYSSWFVHPKVRTTWNDVVRSEKVKALFAGHFHDWQRETYQSIDWLRGTFYLPGFLSKLYICPPISIWFKEKKNEQSCGFQEVFLNKDGKVVVKKNWLNVNTKTFDDEQAKDLAQLKLAKIYENAGRLKDAEDAYKKALASESLLVREKAIDSLYRIVNRQKSFWTQHISPLFNSIFSIFKTVIEWVLILGIVYLLVKVYYKLRGKRRLEVLPFIDSTKDKIGTDVREIILSTYEMMNYHFRAHSWIKACVYLPIITESQSAEIGKLVADVVPGGPGKIIAWMIKRFDKAEFTIQGSLHSSNSNVNIIIRLKKQGEVLGVWDSIFNAQHLFEREKDLAYSVLIFLKEYLSNENAD